MSLLQAQGSQGSQGSPRRGTLKAPNRHDRQVGHSFAWTDGIGPLGSRPRRGRFAEWIISMIQNEASFSGFNIPNEIRVQTIGSKPTINQRPMSRCPPGSPFFPHAPGGPGCPTDGARKLHEVASGACLKNGWDFRDLIFIYFCVIIFSMGIPGS